MVSDKKEQIVLDLVSKIPGHSAFKGLIQEDLNLFITHIRNFYKPKIKILLAIYLEYLANKYRCDITLKQTVNFLNVNRKDFNSSKRELLSIGLIGNLKDYSRFYSPAATILFDMRVQGVINQEVYLQSIEMLPTIISFCPKLLRCKDYFKELLCFAVLYRSTEMGLYEIAGMFKTDRKKLTQTFRSALKRCERLAQLR
ncbi:MAG: hypothetical protein GPJ54_17425 [Candidatus Heimdallarchaeota archaeon]|nr:hypothetical protein [Candidatus Heimdallarchaeota archaeon]